MPFALKIKQNANVVTLFVQSDFQLRNKIELLILREFQHHIALDAELKICRIEINEEPDLFRIVQHLRRMGGGGTSWPLRDLCQDGHRGNTT